jgi:hypothetical protein
MDDDRTSDPVGSRPTGPGRPAEPRQPTEPIRPPDPGTEPIPERVRRPIVVPHQETTIAGLPRPLVLVAVVVLAVALVAGFLIGRATGGDEETSATSGKPGRRAVCEAALTLSLQVAELQRQALVNRTEAAQALAVGDDGRVQELNSELETISSAITEAEARLTPAVERCRGGAGGKGKGGGKGGKGKGAQNG